VLFYLPKNCVTGVNPTIFPPEEDIKWLLAYLNSSLITYLVRGVLIRSNMVTSGYVSCLPILHFTSEEKKMLSEIATSAIEQEISQIEAIRRIDEIIFIKKIFSEEVRNVVMRFCENLAKNV